MNGEDIQTQVDFYADAFEKANAKLGNAELASLIVQQIGKDLRTAQIQGSSGNSGNSNGSQATPKQLAYLKRLAVDVPTENSKQQASEMIDEAVASK